MAAIPREVTRGVHRFGNRFVSWYAIEEDGRLTLVDDGMPRHIGQLTDGLARLGHTLADVDALVLTHAHADHVGFAEPLRQRAGVDVHVDARDADGGVRAFPLFHLYWRRSSWPFLVQGLRDGLLVTKPVERFSVFSDGDTLDLPGRPRVVSVPGHTAGSAALVLRDRGAVFTGDALVTLDPYTMKTGPRLMIAGVNADDALARDSLLRLARVEADLVLPGHGEPWQGDLAAAVERARRT